MTLRTSIVITGDTAEARKALDDLDAEVRRTTQSSEGLTRAQGRVTASAGQLRAASQQLSYQIGDIAQGFALGVPPMTIFTQQGGQVIQSLTLMGGEAKGLLGILGGPWGAVFMGAVSIAGALATTLLSGADAADQDAKAHDALKEAVDRLNSASAAEQHTTRQGIIDDINRANSLRLREIQTRKNIQAELDLAIAEARRAKIAGAINVGSGGAAIQAGGEQLAALGDEARLKAQIAEQDTKIAAVQKAITIGSAKLVLRDVAAATDAATAATQKYDDTIDHLTRRFESGKLDKGTFEQLVLDAAHDRDAAIAAAKAHDNAASSIRRHGEAAKSAAAASRQLAGDLAALEKKYDPAAAAARDYREELDKIAKLEAAGVGGGGIDKATADKYRAMARAAQLGDALGIDDLRPQAEAEGQTLDRARQSIDGLVQSLRDEIEARQALDPVQKEMITHRQQLSALPARERAAQEATIRGLLRQRDATADVTEASREAERAQYDLAHASVGALEDIAVGGDKAGQAIKRLAQSIAAAALDATLLGTGPLAVLLGTAAPRGEIGGLLGSLINGGARRGDTSGGLDQWLGSLASSGGAPNQEMADAVGKSVGKEVGHSMDGIFGKGGSFAATLRNAGLGYAAGSLTGSGTAGALGGSLGGMAGEKLLRGLLGSAAGPVGAIAGGLLGGLIGGLFKKTKQGGVVLSDTTSGGATFGNSSAQIRAASDAAEQVQQGIEQIAQQLGGTLGAFNVSIGTYNGKYRVNPNGGTKLGGGGGKLGNIDFGKDGEADAVAYAIMDAIKDGAVTGLSAAVQKALKSSPDMDKALQEALKVQQVETLAGGIGAEFEQQFKALDQQAQERLRIARQYGFDVVAIEKKNAEDRLKLQQQLLDQQVGSLQRLVDEMTAGSLFEGSSVDKRSAILDQIAKAKTDLDNGVDGAADTLASLFEQLDSVSKDVYGTTGGFATDRSAILDQARAAIAKANAEINAAAGQKTSDPALVATNAALDENNNQNAQIISALRDNSAILSQVAAKLGNSPANSRLLQLARTS